MVKNPDLLGKKPGFPLHKLSGVMIKFDSLPAVPGFEKYAVCDFYQCCEPGAAPVTRCGSGSDGTGSNPHVPNLIPNLIKEGQNEAF
jgi:hypothetical protein